MFDRINEVRQSHGLRPFKFAPALEKSSQSYAKKLMRWDSFSHANPIQAGGSFRTHGEVLAYQSGWRIRRGAAIRMWLNSSSHRALLLSSHFTYSGVGRARGWFQGRLATIWVVQFGRH